MLKRFAIAAVALLATPAFAQTETAPAAPPANGDFVMYITPHADQTLDLSMGFLQLSGGTATIVRRREMAPACQFNPGADLSVNAADVTPIRPPAGIEADRIGQFAALTFHEAAVAKGANPSAEELGCVRALFTAMAQQSMRGQQAPAH
ncbi:hypothetical protein [Terricaulis sp.]|uniref:hypothetical protein n=1 Tax=Terricaulis sp. TaxID=2768686 RepID=UPI003784F30D